MWRRREYAYVIIREDGVAVIEGKDFEVRWLAWVLESSGVRPDELPMLLHPELTAAEVYSGLAYLADHPDVRDCYAVQRAPAEADTGASWDDDFLTRYRQAEGLELQYAFDEDLPDRVFDAA
jgi:hypothetical protein